MPDETEVLEAIRAGDRAAFDVLAARYRPRLHLHCYRMVGSVEDADDLVQDTLLRAWRGRAGFEGRSLFRTWLLRIATNRCLSHLERAPRRVVPRDVAEPVTAATPMSEARDQPAWAPEIAWLEPYPDRLIPDAVAATREDVGLAFLAAIQHLPPRQRAVLLLRDVYGSSAREVARALGITVAAVNGALQRARTVVGARPAPPTEDERRLVERFVDAWHRADDAALIGLLRRDARWSMPPAPLWFDGRDAIERLYAAFPIGRLGTFRLEAVGANRQPAVAAWLRRHGDTGFGLVAVHVLGIREGAIAEVTTFAPSLCARFGLPPTL